MIFIIQSNLRFNESIVPTQKFVETRKFAEANLVMIDKFFLLDINDKN